MGEYAVYRDEVGQYQVGDRSFLIGDGAFLKMPRPQLVCQYIVIHHIPVSDIRDLFICNLESKVVIDSQGMIIVFITGEPDLFESPFSAEFCEEPQGACCQMFSAEILSDIEFA